MTCTGTTANGSACQHHATPGFDTCAAHRRQGQHRDTVLAADLARPDGAISCDQIEPRASRKLSPPAPPQIDAQQARELLARMLHDGLITRKRDGSYHLRSYGTDALTALQTIQNTQEGS